MLARQAHRTENPPASAVGSVKLIVEGENGTAVICPVNVKAKEGYDPAPDTVAEYAEE